MAPMQTSRFQIKSRDRLRNHRKQLSNRIIIKPEDHRLRKTTLNPMDFTDFNYCDYVDVEEEKYPSSYICHDPEHGQDTGDHEERIEDNISIHENLTHFYHGTKTDCFSVRQQLPIFAENAWDKSKFQRMKVIGKGASGKVMKVRDRTDGRFFAVKQLDASSAINVYAFTTEVKLLRTLSHPHIVQIHESCSDDENLYIVTELLHGVFSVFTVLVCY